MADKKVGPRHKLWWANALSDAGEGTVEELMKKKMEDLKKIAEGKKIKPTPEEYAAAFSRPKKEAKKPAPKMKNLNINDEFDTFDGGDEDEVGDEGYETGTETETPSRASVQHGEPYVERSKKFKGIRINGLLILGNLKGNSIEFL